MTDEQINVKADASIDILAEALCIDSMNVCFAEGMILPPSWGLADFGIDTFIKAFVIVVIVVMIALEVGVSVPCATVVRADTMIDVLTGMVFSAVAVFVNVNVSSGVYTNT